MEQGVSLRHEGEERVSGSAIWSNQAAPGSRCDDGMEVDAEVHDVNTVEGDEVSVGDSGRAVGAGADVWPFLPGAAGRLLDMLEGWPELGELRLAQNARGRARLAAAMGQLTCTVRVQFGKGLMEYMGTAENSDSRGQGKLCQRAAATYQKFIDLLQTGLADLQAAWRWKDREVIELRSQLQGLVGAGNGRGPGVVTVLHDTGIGVVELGAAAVPGRLGSGRCLFFMGLAGGWGWERSLCDLGDLGVGVFSGDGRIFRPCGRELSAADLGSSCREWMLGQEGEQDTYFVAIGPRGVLSVRGSYDMRPGRMDNNKRVMVIPTDGRRPFPTRWLPEYIRLPRDVEGRIQYPKYGVATVVEAADRWEELMGPLDGTTKAIVQGRYVVPRTTQPTRRDWRPNHRSWEQDPKAKLALGGKLAEWMYRGILGAIPDNVPCPPVSVSPLSAVDKATDPFYRLVQDAREPNKGVAPWKVKYYSAQDLAMLLDYGDFAFGLDMADAYHATALPGCHTRRRTESWLETGLDGQLVERQQLRLGCSARDCSSFCDKSMAAVMIEGQLFRLEAAILVRPQRVLRWPVSWTLCVGFWLEGLEGLGLRYGNGLAGGALPSVVLVDDTVWVVKAIRHGICGGLDAECIECGLLQVEGLAAMAVVEGLFAELHLWLNNNKRQLPGQRIVYTGIILDTIQGRYYCPEEKRIALISVLQDMGAAALMPARAVASVRGKLLHYACCLPYIQAYAPWFSQIIRTEGEVVSWDEIVQLPHDAAEVCKQIIAVIEDTHMDGVALWPYVASSLHASISRGDFGAGRGRLRITHDASFEGWAAKIEWCKGTHIVVGTFSAEERTDFQVRREALAGDLAFQAASQLLDVRGMVVLHRNDAIGALAALRKGSYASTALQAISVRFNQCRARLRTEHYFVHVPGTVLVDEGVDAASRGLARQVSFPACTPRMRDLLQTEAVHFGWTISIDLFAQGSMPWSRGSARCMQSLDQRQLMLWR